MCGIVGIVNSNPESPVDENRLRAMCARLVHRGPDDAGYFACGHVGLAMRRLSIIDLAGGKQPIANEDETVWVVLNGEIYNYRTLRSDLESRGHRFRTSSDTEVIVHLYEDLGVDCVKKLRGMFAFAIWDMRRRSLFIARDRLGIKPLYYAAVGTGLYFASELKSLLECSEISKAVSPDAVAEYFVNLYVPGELSIYTEIRKLAAGHSLTYQDGKTAVFPYWHVEYDPDYRVTEREWIEQLQVHLRSAVESHMVADVPVGAFLSGGLDSGSMVALMAEAAREPVRTFTVGFTSETVKFDERAAANIVAERHATRHHECLLDADVATIFPKLAEAFDEPFADSSAIPNWLVCQETAKYVKVALTGLGGDELFGGYERYVGLQLGESYHHIPKVLRRIISALVLSVPSGNGTSPRMDRLKRFVVTGDLPTHERYRSFISAFGNLADVLHPDLLGHVTARTPRYDHVLASVRVKEPLDVALLSDLYQYLPDDLLTLSDRISMAHSLEVRVPFLDHELVEFVAKIPAAFKVKGLNKKVLFKKAIADWLPPGHLARPKQGFSIPLSVWLRGPLRALLLDYVASQELRQSPWIDGRKVQRLVDEHLSGAYNHEIRLWGVLCFLEWSRVSRTAMTHRQAS